METTRRNWIMLAICTSVLGVPTPDSRAQGVYPSRPIRLVVGFAPGGANDLIARAIADSMGQALSQPVIVENKPGADGIVAAEHVARSPADGYTIFFAGSGPVTINPAIYRKLPYDPQKDFAPVATVGTMGVVVVARPTLGAQTIADVIRIARERPGGLTFGSGSTSFQMAGEMFARQAGIKLLHVPYKGAGPAAVALAAGDIDLMFSDPAAIVALATAGRVKAIAMTSEPRPNGMPNLPTVSESGLPDFDFNFFVGLVVPAATPAEVVSRIYEAARAAVSQARVRETMMDLGIRPSGNSPQQTAERIQVDIQRFRALAKAANIQAAH